MKTKRSRKTGMCTRSKQSHKSKKRWTKSGPSAKKRLARDTVGIIDSPRNGTVGLLIGGTGVMEKGNNWRNWTDVYAHVDKKQLVKKLRKAIRGMKWEKPSGIPTTKTITLGRTIFTTGREWGSCLPLGLDLEGLQQVSQHPCGCQHIADLCYSIFQARRILEMYRACPQGLSD